MAATLNENSPLLGSDHGSSSEDGSVEVAKEVVGVEVGILSASSIKEDALEEPPAEEKTQKKALYKYLPGYGVFHLLKNASIYSMYVLLLLLAAYLLNQLNRYTLPVTTKAVAQSVHYGSMSCMINTFTEENGWISQDERSNLSSICTNKFHKHNETSCVGLEYEYSNCTTNTTSGCDSNITAHACKYDYDGSGLDYQILAGSAFNNVYPVAGLILGPLADFISRKILLAVCLLFLSVFTGLIGFAAYYWQLVLLRMGVAIFAAGCTPYAASLITDYFVPELRGSALGVYNWGIYLGYSFAFLLGNQITHALGWRWVFFISALMGIAVTPLLIFTIREKPKKKAQQSNDSESVNQSATSESSSPQPAKRKLTIEYILGYVKVLFVTFILSPSMIVLLVSGGIRNAGGYVWAYNTQLFFNNYRGFTADEISSFMSWIPLVAGSLGAFVGGLISDIVVAKRGSYWRVWVLIISQVLAAPFAAGALFIPYSPWCFLMLIPSNVIGEMWIGVTLALVVDIVPGAIKTASVAIYLFVITIIGGNFNLVVDPINKALGERYEWTLFITFPGLYLLSSVLFLCTFFLLRFDLKRKKKREEMAAKHLQGTAQVM